ncbi:MAG: hypothetical protein WC841_03545 [Candidatus Shapirobacteria bacterium]|jgi:hypothetical protein
MGRIMDALGRLGEAKKAQVKVEFGDIDALPENQRRWNGLVLRTRLAAVDVQTKFQQGAYVVNQFTGVARHLDTVTSSVGAGVMTGDILTRLGAGGIGSTLGGGAGALCAGALVVTLSKGSVKDGEGVDSRPALAGRAVLGVTLSGIAATQVPIVREAVVVPGDTFQTLGNAAIVGVAVSTAALVSELGHMMTDDYFDKQKAEK